MVGFVEAVHTDTDAVLSLGAPQPFPGKSGKINGYVNVSGTVTYVTV